MAPKAVLVGMPEDFLQHPLVRRVIVVSNNSTDHTVQRAQEANAIVFNEPLPGYGRCVYRCLTEAVQYDDTELIVLCEGDLTFRAHDLDKFLAYVPHADIVNGTRIVEQLRAYETQLSPFMYYGNFFVGKLLEAKHLGKGTCPRFLPLTVKSRLPVSPLLIRAYLASPFKPWGKQMLVRAKPR